MAAIRRRTNLLAVVTQNWKKNLNEVGAQTIMEAVNRFKDEIDHSQADEEVNNDIAFALIISLAVNMTLQTTDEEYVNHVKNQLQNLNKKLDLSGNMELACEILKGFRMTLDNYFNNPDEVNNIIFTLGKNYLVELGW